MRWPRLPLAAVLLAAFAAPGAAGAQDGGARLVRCGAEGRVACLSAGLTLRPEDAGALARTDHPGGTWRMRLAERELSAASVTVPAESRPPLRLLVLVDVSGSMKGGERMQTARSALRSFLAELPTGSVRAAVAPFASANVAGRIRDTRFVAPADAGAQVDALPEPQGNTGLYSAVAEGVERLAAERRAAGAAAGWDALVVVTDGRNDVGLPGDDPGLLAGAEGRRRAVEAVRASGAHVFAVGFGSGVDGEELRVLGGVRGEGFRVEDDPVALRRALRRIAGWVLNSRDLLVPVGGSADARLAPGRLILSAVARAGGSGPELTASSDWRPPLLALPAFAGRAPEAVAVAGEPDPWLLRRGAVLAFFGGVFLLLWTAVPRLLRPRHPVEPTAPAAALPAGEAPPGPARPRVRLRGTAAAASAALPAGGAGADLFQGLREAPPRRPTDVTASVSRPLVRRAERLPNG